MTDTTTPETATDTAVLEQTKLSDAAVDSQLSTVLDLDQLLSAAKMAERVVWVCMNGPLLAEQAVVRAELRELVDEDNNVVSEADEETFIGEVSRAQALANRDWELQAQIARERVPFRFRAIDSDAWEEHEKAHMDAQGRPKNSRAWENQTIALSAVSPAIDVAGAEKLRKGVNQAQFIALFNGAYLVNKADGVNVPFSPLSSPARNPQR